MVQLSQYQEQSEFIQPIPHTDTLLAFKYYHLSLSINVVTQHMSTFTLHQIHQIRGQR